MEAVNPSVKLYYTLSYNSYDRYDYALPNGGAVGVENEWHDRQKYRMCRNFGVPNKVS
jgi:hypothetical protein